MIYFSGKINLTIGERPNKKNIESLNLTWKVNILRFRRGIVLLSQLEIVKDVTKEILCRNLIETR